VVITRYLNLALILGLLSTPALGSPVVFETGICTHMTGLDVMEQVKPMQPASPNAIQNTRNALIDQLGRPTFENSYSPGGITLTWVKGVSAESVSIQIANGNLQVTCGLTF
jgi:hypothetical protein